MNWKLSTVQVGIMLLKIFVIIPAADPQDAHLHLIFCCILSQLPVYLCILIHWWLANGPSKSLDWALVTDQYVCLIYVLHWSIMCPDSKVHGANMGPIWGQQDPGGPHVGPMNFAVWAWSHICCIGPSFTHALTRRCLIANDRRLAKCNVFFKHIKAEPNGHHFPDYILKWILLN